VLHVGHCRRRFVVVRGVVRRDGSHRIERFLETTALAVGCGDSAGGASGVAVVVVVAVVDRAVHVLLLLGENDDLPPFLRCEP